MHSFVFSPGQSVTRIPVLYNGEVAFTELRTGNDSKFYVSQSPQSNKISHSNWRFSHHQMEGKPTKFLARICTSTNVTEAPEQRADSLRRNSLDEGMDAYTSAPNLGLAGQNSCAQSNESEWKSVRDHSNASYICLERIESDIKADVERSRDFARSIRFEKRQFAIALLRPCEVQYRTEIVLIYGKSRWRSGQSSCLSSLTVFWIVVNGGGLNRSRVLSYQCDCSMF